MPVDTVISQDLLDDTDEDLDEDDVDDVRRLRAAQAAIQVGWVRYKDDTSKP